MSALRDWLEVIGLGQYADAFEANDIDTELLPQIDDQMLTDIGVSSAGHRLRIRNAIAKLVPTSITEPNAARAAMAAEAHATSPERRQLTVMFCDLVGSTPLSTRLDPEDLREVIGRYHACVAETVSRFDGFVAKYMGDGVLVYFGYPHAHEDDAEQVVRAGLALVNAVGELKAPGPLQLRIGIATGLVVVGDLIGAGSAQEQAIVGETPNLAARLQALAEANTVVIAESTRRLIGGLFELADLGPQSLKGFAEPQRAWRALAENRALGRFEALRSGATPLVGREEEIELLLRRWTQAKAGNGRVVLLAGEAGIGKSRLTAALTERIAGEPHTRFRYFCSPQHTNSALYPIIGQIERAAELAHDDAPSAKLDKLDALLARTQTSPEDAGLLAEMLSLANDGRYPVLALPPEQRRARTLGALLAQVEAFARQCPVLMIFEDAHWSDPTSLEALGRTIDRIATLRVLVVMTFRPEYAPPWIGQPQVTVLTLNRLAIGEAGTLIDRIAGNRALPAGVREDIVERTDGIPLFVEEMTKAVLEAGSEGAARDAAASVPPATHTVPASLHASLMARLDRLGAAKRVAQIGAAIGREFSRALLAAVVGEPEAELDAALDRLVVAGLLFRQGLPPPATYLFKHALVQDAAYGTLLRSRRRQLHAGIAATVEARFPEIVATQPALLAHHCTEAGLTEKAVDYWLAAGRQAWGRSAALEAVALLRRGLALVPALPDGDWRLEREFELQNALGQALVASRSGVVPDVGEAYARTGQLAKVLNRPRELLFALYGEWVYHTIRADLDRARQLAAEMHGLDIGHVAARVLSRGASGFTCLHLAEYAVARDDLEEALALFNPADRPFYAELLIEDQLVALLAHLAYSLCCLGHLDRAMSRRDAALSEARRLSDPHDLALALSYVWITGRCIGSDPKSMFQCADQLLALTTEHGLGYYRTLALILRGWCLAASGRADEGISLLTTDHADIEKLGFIIWRSWRLAHLGDTCRMAGRWQAALHHFAEARRLAEETGDRWFLAETIRLRGDVLLTTGDPSGAEASFREAVAIAQQQSAKLWELRAAMSLARLWRDQGKGKEARDLLAPVYDWFTEGFVTPVLQEAKSLLVELAA
jgi:class 3 adenylate cyclase/predicted ATPase